MFPISRDPPEGGTGEVIVPVDVLKRAFPISRDPPEGGTEEAKTALAGTAQEVSNF